LTWTDVIDPRKPSYGSAAFAAKRIAAGVSPTSPTTDQEEITMSQRHLSKRSVTCAGFAVSVLLGFAGAALTPAPAGAVVYCQYIDYPPSCVARAGVVLRPRPVARAAVRATTVTTRNINGGVNRVGIR
jgi:hypothetical protein